MKQTLRQRFPAPHIVLPVIHVASQEQALRNAAIARDAAADGIFLINHHVGSTELLQIHEVVADAFPDWWIGLNCLGMAPATVFTRISDRVNGVWVDNAMIDERQEEQPAANAVVETHRRRGWQGLYFGGVAFKYQREVDDLEEAARIAKDYMDVVTTSGLGTGSAADVEKIRTMKQALGDAPLAIASGITPENIGHYLPWSDCYLVATGISRNFEDLDPELTRRLVQKVRAYDAERK